MKTVEISIDFENNVDEQELVDAVEQCLKDLYGGSVSVDGSTDVTDEQMAMLTETSTQARRALKQRQDNKGIKELEQWAENEASKIPDEELTIQQRYCYSEAQKKSEKMKIAILRREGL